MAWAHGVAAVQGLGGMLGPVTFLLPDGRQVSPLHVAPWFDEPGRRDQPPILQELRGEWPCVPFGADGPRVLPEGWSETGEALAGQGSRTGIPPIPNGHSHTPGRTGSRWSATTLKTIRSAD
jgi:hypothetical protein